MNKEKYCYKMHFQILLKLVKKEKHFPLASVSTTPVPLFCCCFHFWHVHFSISNFCLKHTHRVKYHPFLLTVHIPTVW